MPICTSCAQPTVYLYTVYDSAYNFRLEQCVSLLSHLAFSGFIYEPPSYSDDHANLASRLGRDIDRLPRVRRPICRA